MSDIYWRPFHSESEFGGCIARHLWMKIFIVTLDVTRVSKHEWHGNKSTPFTLRDIIEAYGTRLIELSLFPCGGYGPGARESRLLMILVCRESAECLFALLIAGRCMLRRDIAALLVSPPHQRSDFDFDVDFDFNIEFCLL